LSNLTKRIISALIGITIVTLILVYAKSWIWKLLILHLTMLGLNEFFKNMVTNRFPEFKDLRHIGILLGGTISSIILFYPQYLAITPTVFFLIVSLYFLFNFKSMDTVIERMGYLILGIVYISFTLPYIGLIVEYDKFNGNYLLVLVFAITWGKDTFAYTFGRLFGKHKLYEKMSPKKTIEGSIGGLFGGVGLAILVKIFLLKEISYIDLILIATLAGMLGQMGDLVESMFKRYFKIKDSGLFLPGHGGVLDRFDSVMFNAPAVYFYFELTNGGLF
jgi:phosphatidate cytidylyltransferase